MVSALISRVVILVFGTLYPAYASYKAVKNKNVKEYVKWMMYWIVFALFTTVETFADVLVSWFPFYYELKIAFVVWLLSPATKGSSILYRKFVHPELMKRENEIDITLDRVKTQGYSTLVNVGQQGFNFAVQKAITGQDSMINQLMKKSLSMGDISQPHRPAAAQRPFQPQAERIPEVMDETDVSRSGRATFRQESYEDMPDPVTGLPPAVEVCQLEGGHGRSVETVLPSAPPEPSMPVIQAKSQSGYNLRSHEYHGGAEQTSSRQSYHHGDGYHYGTLPRRAASMRSNVNTALPSRWRKTNTSAAAVSATPSQ